MLHIIFNFLLRKKKSAHISIPEANAVDHYYNYKTYIYVMRDWEESTKKFLMILLLLTTCNRCMSWPTPSWDHVFSTLNNIYTKLFHNKEIKLFKKGTIFLFLFFFEVGEGWHLTSTNHCFFYVKIYIYILNLFLYTHRNLIKLMIFVFILLPHEVFNACMHMHAEKETK